MPALDATPVALAVAAEHPEAFRSLIVVEAPFHGLRHMDLSVLKTLAGLQARVSRARPDIKTVVVPGASDLVHLDQPREFIAAVRAAAGPRP
jgi:pimeloyl-ACP methyl ester carboxylesterase